MVMKTFWYHPESNSWLVAHTEREARQVAMECNEVTQEEYMAKAESQALMEMEVFIPSRSRWQRSLTLEAIQGQWPNVALVVPKDQKDKYAPLAKRHGVKLYGSSANGIAMTRQAIGNAAKDRFLMLDDDLRFSRRASPDSPSLHMFNKRDMQDMLLFVSRALDIYKHVAVSAREGNNRLEYPWVTNSRPLRALAYRKREFMRCHHGRVAIMEDFDVTLQLIKQGFPNCVITQYAQDQPGTQAAGGCSDYRTHALHEANVRKMAQLHPGLVKLRDKVNKTGGEFGSRLEATIYWEKAYKSALEEFL